MSAASPGGTGAYGKIPARGDFIRLRLARSFVVPWDDWLQAFLTESRAALGESWQAAWMEAPIWHFALDPGLCGPDAVLGLWLPSVDRAGRLFPLTIAVVVPEASAASLAEAAADWLAWAEPVGLAAVLDGMPPERLDAALDSAPPVSAQAAAGTGASRWWTDGAPRVAPRATTCRGLPAGAACALLLADRAGAAL